MLATLAVRLQSLQVGDVLKLALLAWSRTLDLKGAVFFWCFCLVAINMHFVFVGFSAIRFLQHHPETSYRLCCKSLRILSMLSLAVLRVPSSANKSHWTDARVRHRGKSLIKMQNRSRERDRETERQRERQRETERDRDRDRERES